MAGKPMPPGGYTNRECPVCGDTYAENQAWVNCAAYVALVCMAHCWVCCYHQIGHCRYPKVIHPERKKRDGR